MEETKSSSESKEIKIIFESIDKNTVRVFNKQNGNEKELATMLVISKKEIEFFESAIKYEERD